MLFFINNTCISFILIKFAWFSKNCTHKMLEDECVLEVTKEPSGYIKAIAKDTVHKICSGQVVLSLAVAVKELVENAIDAGATLVEVKLRNQGLESVEVSDNGSGVEENNLVAMTAKYHTSKIREFVDLQGVETFGFRGEALSSLCALSDMTIITRHKSSDVGIKIELDHEGKVKKRLPCARSVGTTVTLSNLFVTLPVRKRDFMRNIKKEFNKMCQILQAYCLVAKGVRIICSNQSAKGGKVVVMQTHGSQDILANISAVFGSKQTADIIPMKLPFTDDCQLTEQSLLADLKDDANMQISDKDIELLNAAEFHIEGYVSSCSHGSGRSSKDRQYFYINSRPCDPRNIAKVVNEIYHRYNAQQHPFVYLNVITARSEVDINLTPDKRQLLLHNEKILLLAIKKSLLNTFGNIPSTYKMENSTIKRMFNNLTQPVETLNSVDPNVSNLVPISSTQRFADVLSQWRLTGDTKGTAPHLPSSSKRKCNDEIAVRTLKLQKIQEFLTKETAANKQDNVGSYQSDSDSDCTATDKQTSQKDKLQQSVVNINELNKQSAEYDALTSNITANSSTIERIDCKTVPSTVQSYLNFIETKTQIDSDDEIITIPQPFLTLQTKEIELDDSGGSPDDDRIITNYSCAELRTSLADIELGIKSEELLMHEKRESAKLERLRFKSEINPSQNQKAEIELQKEISKEDFAQMEILGQFNLGFIIVKLDTDLFIIDQHATDEKYNFEMLQSTTVLQNQKLVVPQALEMTAVNEMILLDHLEVFEKNGFKFEIDVNAPATKKIRLLAKPFSKNWEFGKDDIDELIFMLQDAPQGTICRPSRVRAMFASRACRKSVMIGNPLNNRIMKMLVTHMGEIEQPWNCPHGRPTMRHLINVAMLHDVDDKQEHTN